MALPDYHPHFTEPVENDTHHPVVPHEQPRPTPVTVHHHRIPQTWQALDYQNKYQCQDWQHPDPNWRLYQNQQPEEQHGCQHFGWQQHHEQRSLHHVSANLQSQYSANDHQHHKATLANLPPAAAGALPAIEQSSKRSYSLSPFDHIRHDQELSVLNQYVDQPESVPATSASEASFYLQRSPKSLDEGTLRSPLSSPTSPHDSSNIQDHLTSVRSGSRQPSSPTNHTWNSQNLDALGQTSGQRSRVRTACSECRHRKRKCDKKTPCGSCQERKLTCDRPEPAPAITKEASENHVSTLQENRNMLRGGFVRESSIRTNSGMQDVKRQKHRHDPEDSAIWSVSTRSRILSTPQSENEHRTGPHHLIDSWPTLKVLLQAAHVKLDCTYVMQAEDRPSLCLHPEDEEVANWDDAQAGGLTGFVHYDDNTPGNVLPTSTKYCGYDSSGGKFNGYGVRPQRYGVERRNSINKAPPNAATVEALYESYTKHIHVMQPFLDIGEVRGLLDDFIAWHGMSVQRSGRRRLGHAVVYLILALGEICMHSDALPADSPSIGQSEMPSSSLGRTYGAESSSLSFDNAEIILRVSSQTPSADGRPHVNEGATTRRVPGLDHYVKAVEIFGVYSDGNDLIHAHLFLLAGLYKGQLARVKESMSWYTMAGRVLLQLLHSHGLQDKNHWKWTSEGGKAVQERNQEHISDKHRSSIVRASYSCIQLESDIRADLDLPSSGIISLETMLPVLEAFADVSRSHEDSAQSANVPFHFTSQVYLRIRLNQIHRQLYGPDCEGLSLAETQCILQEHEAIIGTWQNELPTDMSWGLEDAPPTDILHARLRAKYWGARYLINRPFLDYILHIKPHPRLTVAEVAPDSRPEPRCEAEFHLFRAISEMSEEEVQIGYQTCIKAAEKSTIAFDNVLGRPIVTNIHGTAHAQFGNVLVLCDVYWHPDLCQLVDETNLRHLLSRTISFLDKLTPISPTCRIDCLVLKKVQWLIFDIPY